MGGVCSGLEGPGAMSVCLHVFVCLVKMFNIFTYQKRLRDIEQTRPMPEEEVKKQVEAS